MADMTGKPRLNRQVETAAMTAIAGRWHWRKVRRIWVSPTAVVPDAGEVADLKGAAAETALLGGNETRATMSDSDGTIALQYLLWRRWRLVALLPFVVVLFCLRVSDSVSVIETTINITRINHLTRDKVGLEVISASMTNYMLYTYIGGLIVGVVELIGFVLALAFSMRWRMSRLWLLASWCIPFGFV